MKDARRAALEARYSAVMAEIERRVFNVNLFVDKALADERESLEKALGIEAE